MSALWEIDEQIENIMNTLVDEETGEINEEALEQLEQLGIEREEKLENCGVVIKNLKAEIEAIQNEIKALKRRAEIKANKVDRLMAYVENSLKGEPLETSKVSYSFRKSERVEISEDALVPDQWCEYKIERKPKKNEIKAALKNGESISGCQLVEKMNLQIK